MDSDYHWLVTTALVASSFIAITANSFLLLVFCRRRSLRTVPNRFVINLLITNLLSSILLIPLLLADQKPTSHVNSTEILIREELFEKGEQRSDNIEIIERKEIDQNITRDVLCHFAQSSTSFVCTASIFSILLIGINQYFGVIHSLRYHFYINKFRSTVFILSSWVLALLCAILSALTYSDNSLWTFCKDVETNSDAVRVFNTVYAFAYFIIVILAPFLAICVIYVCIYTAAHKNSERMRKSTSTNAVLDYNQMEKSMNHLPKVHSAPNFSHLVREKSFIEVVQAPKPERSKVTRTSSERTTFISNLKHKISNASAFRYREETRAAKISILVIFMVLVCYIPYGITLILSSDYVEVKTNQIFHYLSLILLIFSNIISPFLFGYRNKRVKREIGKVFGFTKPNQRLGERKQAVIVNNRSLEDLNESFRNANEPFTNNRVIPEVIITCKPEVERKSILKKCTSSWTNYKKCNFITVPESCISGEARGSFSSASTQISSEE